jgi:hypothetical protein
MHLLWQAQREAGCICQGLLVSSSEEMGLLGLYTRRCDTIFSYGILLALADDI